MFQESVRQELMRGRRGDQRQVRARRDFGARYATRGKKRERWGFAAESADVWRVHRHRSRVSKLGPKLLNTAQLGGAAVYHPPKSGDAPRCQRADGLRAACGDGTKFNVEAVDPMRPWLRSRTRLRAWSWQFQLESALRRYYTPGCNTSNSK